MLFSTPDRSFYTNEAIALARSGAGAVQRELAGLPAADLLAVHKQGDQKHYQANYASPVFEELRGLELKTMGLADVLRHALAPLSGQIGRAFVFGSTGKRQHAARSDIDVLVVSDVLGYGDLSTALECAHQTLGRAINPVLYSEAEFQRRLQENNAFLTHVMRQPKTWLRGEQEPSRDDPSLSA